MGDQFDMNWRHENVVSLAERRDKAWQRRFDSLQNRARAVGLEIVPAREMYGDDEPGWAVAIRPNPGDSIEGDAGVPSDDLGTLEYFIACEERGR